MSAPPSRDSIELEPVQIIFILLYLYEFIFTLVLLCVKTLFPWSHSSPLALKIFLPPLLGTRDVFCIYKLQSALFNQSFFLKITYYLPKLPSFSHFCFQLRICKTMWTSLDHWLPLLSINLYIFLLINLSLSIHSNTFSN